MGTRRLDGIPTPALRVQVAVSWLDHRFAVRRLDAYVDGELGGDDVDRVTGHLVLCEHCSAHVRFLLEVRASLQHLQAWRVR